MQRTLLSSLTIDLGGGRQIPLKTPRGRSDAKSKLVGFEQPEEKIIKLQEKKRAAIDATIEEPLMTGLTSEELEELLA